MSTEAGAPWLGNRCRLRTLSWLSAALLVLATGALLVASPSAWLMRADAAGLALAATLRHPALDAFARGVTWLGSLYVLMPAAALIGSGLARGHRPWSVVIFVPLAVSGAALLAHLGKWLVGRPRPDLYASLIPLPVEPGYPSGHALQAAAFGLAVLLAWRPRAGPARWLSGLLVSAAVLAVLASRIHLQVHFPSDVVFGALAGVCWALALGAALLPAGHRPANR